MALPALDTEARLLRLIAVAEPRLRLALVNSIVAARAASSLGELEVLIVEGRFEEAVALAARTGVVRLAGESSAVFVLAGRDTSLFLTDVVEVVVDFDQVNFRAVSTMQQSRLRLIREFTTEQLTATREALTEGISRGLNPREQARAFRDSIGLTAKQQRAVDNYRRLLEQGSSEALQRGLRDARFDSTVQAAVRGDRVLTADQVRRMTDRYRERMLAFRAETIARTEALRAVHQGSEEAYRQAFDEGLLDPGAVTRSWVTARDERVRGSHAAMSGQRRTAGETFVSGNGHRLMHPGDPNAPASETVQCRCALATRLA